jgi:Protein of unknown function (DUF550)
MIELLRRQWKFSVRTFGPYNNVAGIIDHIKKELVEVEADPSDLEEWIDIAILAFDGALRQGFTPQQVVRGYEAKLAKNKQRTWPDWRTADLGKAIEHVRDEDMS